MEKRKALDDRQLMDMLEQIVMNCAIDHRTKTIDARRDPTAQDTYVANIFMDYGFGNPEEGNTPEPMMMRVTLTRDYNTRIGVENVDLEDDSVGRAVTFTVDFNDVAFASNPCKSSSDTIEAAMDGSQGFTLNDAKAILERLIFEGHWNGDAYAEEIESDARFERSYFE